MRAGALGDVLLLRRAVAALKRAGHEVHLLAPEPAGRVLVGSGPSEVKRLVPLDGPDMARLLAGEPAPGSLETDLRADATIAVTEATDLLDVVRTRGGRLLSRSPHPKPGGHAAVWCAAPTRALGANPSTPPPPLEHTVAEHAATDGLRDALGGDGFLAVHPGSGSRNKNWPSDRFVAMVRELEPHRPFLVVAGPADDHASAPLLALPRAVVARGLPVRDLGALLSHAGLHVGNDSGVTHLAAASGAPTVALFGPTDPATWAPEGERVGVARSATGSMEDLPAADVITLAAELRAPR